MDSAVRRFEENAQSLVGLRLAAVRYVELSYESLADLDRRPEFDSLDFGLELVGDNGRVVGLTWDEEFEYFCIAIQEGGMGKEGRAVLDVSETSRWSSCIGNPVTRIDVGWIEDEESSVRFRRLPWVGWRFPALRSWVARRLGRAKVREMLFPLSLVLHFGPQRVWVAAVQVLESGRPYYGADNVIVAFDGHVAQQLAGPAHSLRTPR